MTTPPSRQPADKTSIRHQQMQGFADLTLCGLRKHEHKKSDVKISTVGHRVSCPDCLVVIAKRKKNHGAHLKKMAKVRKARKEEHDSINYRDSTENGDW